MMDLETVMKGPGPRFELESRDPQSHRMPGYPNRAIYTAFQ